VEIRDIKGLNCPSVSGASGHERRDQYGQLTFKFGCVIPVAEWGIRRLPPVKERFVAKKSLRTPVGER
jgi:hypothetical protein